MVFDSISSVCETMTLFQIYSIYKDKANGNWVLKLKREPVLGIWPSRFFTSLANFATCVEWGGEVYSPPHIPSPEMGIGVDPSYHGGDCSAQCTDIKLVNEDRMSPVKYEDINKYYQFIDGGYVGDNLQHVFSYGGKGGYVGN
ncbi:hypothetical protein M5689_019571 [Euphorbia peplus]|nr:hypothetical protein M5689_019571 [Euphorbia peplus]